ncbi:MAG: tetratricopeptide repeat protein, partial [Nitrosotalea sp.]
MVETKSTILFLPRTDRMYSDIEKSQLQTYLIAGIIKHLVREISLVTNFELVRIEISHETRKKIESLISIYKKSIFKNSTFITKSSLLSIETEFGLCNFFYNIKNYESALEQLENIIKLQPYNTKATRCRVIIQELLGKFEQAIKSCDEILDIDQCNLDVLYRKGILFLKLIRHKEAIECFDKVLNINPRHELALYNKGMVLSGMTRREEAIECFDRVLENN